MARRGRSTTIGKFAKIYLDRRVSEIRVLGEALRREQRAAPTRRTARAELSDQPMTSRHHD